MNEHEQFMPAWAEKQFGPKPDNELECKLLWAFFDAWESLHAIKGDKRNPEIRKQYEDAAQTMVDAAHPLRVLRKNHAS